jgi:hypothetical protein
LPEGPRPAGQGDGFCQAAVDWTLFFVRQWRRAGLLACRSRAPALRDKGADIRVLFFVRQRRRAGLQACRRAPALRDKGMDICQAAVDWTLFFVWQWRRADLLACRSRAPALRANPRRYYMATPTSHPSRPGATMTEWSSGTNTAEHTWHPILPSLARRARTGPTSRAASRLTPGSSAVCYPPLSIPLSSRGPRQLRDYLLFGQTYLWAAPLATAASPTSSCWPRTAGHGWWDLIWRHLGA